MSPSNGQFVMPSFIQLVPGANDTMESWFKIGNADAIADRLYAEGRTRACVITTSTLDFMGNAPQMPGFSVKTLRADDYPTWGLRRLALVKMLIELNRESSPSFPGMGGGFGGPGGMDGPGGMGGPDF